MGFESKHRSKNYHHGDLAESLLEAVDHIAQKFGLEAVTLRACAKLLGVAPSAGFRHYADKKALFTAFAARAQRRMAKAMSEAAASATANGESAFLAVGLSYIRFALEEPAAFQVMWRSELIYGDDPAYQAATEELTKLFRQGFAESVTDEDANALGAEEFLAWSTVHGVASLYTDGPHFHTDDREAKLARAKETLSLLLPTLE